MRIKLASVAFAIFCAAGFSSAATAAPDGGTFSGAIDNQKVQLRGGFDHVTVEETASAVNKGPGSPLDGARIQIKETVTLDKGQGVAQGVITFTTAGGSATSRYTTKVTTDAKGAMTARGAFKTVSGTGAFARLRGSGDTTTVFTSKTAFASTWKGDFTGLSSKVSRR